MALQTKRIVEIDGTLNFRDIGGYTTADGRSVKWGQVYRCAQLDRLSDAGIESLAKLRVATVVDLRFSEESERYPTLKTAVPNAEMLSWHQEWLNQETQSNDNKPKLKWHEGLKTMTAADVRETMRVNYPQKLYSHAAIYKKMLLRIGQAQTPLVFHCAAGKDRTGIAAALILGLLGVDKQQIIDDYLLTQQLIEGRIESWMAGGATTQQGYQDFQQELSQYPKELLAPLFNADKAYIDTLLDYVETTYGDFNAYADTQLGLNESFVQQLKSQMLD